MKKLRLILLTVLAVLLIFGVSACGEQGPEPSQETQGTDPTHIYEEAGENLLIDADVIRPEGNAVPKVYVAEFPEFTKENVDPLLAFLGDEVVSVLNEFTENQMYYYRVETKNGGDLIVHVNHDVNNKDGGFSYLIPEFDQCYNIADGYQRTKSGPASSEESTMQLYTEPKVFSFATEQQAEEEVRKAFATIGLTDLVLENTLYLDHAVLEAYEAENMAKWQEEYKELGMTYTPKDAWTEEDDCYEFTFCCGVDGVPMIQENLLTPISSISSCFIGARCNSHGIVRLGASSSWKVGEVASTPERIVSALEAMETVKEKLNGVYLGHDVVVEEIALRYMPIQDKDRWLLTPVWEVLICEKDVYYQWADVTVDERSYIHIDSLTGKEI